MISTMRQAFATGFRWTGLSAVLLFTIQFGQLAVLARLLDQSDFGLFRMALVAVGFARSFADLGTAARIVQQRRISDDALSSVYWLQLTGATLFWAGLALTSGFVSGFYEEPRLIEVLFWLAMQIPILAAGQPFEMLLQKELRFRRLASVEVAASGSGAAVAIGAALLQAGAMSLVWGYLAAAAVKSVVLLAIGLREWRPRFRIRRQDLAAFYPFGHYQMGERAVNYVAANVDYVIIGRFLGPTSLGLYTIAYQLSVLPLQWLNPMLNRVAFPIFSERQQENAVLAGGFRDVLRLLGYVVFPFGFGLWALAPLGIEAALGSGWEGAAPILQVLVFVGVLKCFGNPAGSIYLAKGRADLGFKLNVLMAVACTSAFLVVVQHGATAVALASLGLALPMLVVSTHLACGLIEASPWKVYGLLARQAGLAIPSAAAAWLVFSFYPQPFPNAAVSLGVYGLGGCVLYGVTLFGQAPEGSNGDG